jgi:hypothetical protein
MSYGRRRLLQNTSVVVVHWSRVVGDANRSSVGHCCVICARSRQDARLVLTIDRSAYIGIAIIWGTGDNIFIQIQRGQMVWRLRLWLLRLRWLRRWR